MLFQLLKDNPATVIQMTVRGYGPHKWNFISRSALRNNENLILKKIHTFNKILLKTTPYTACLTPFPQNRGIQTTTTFKQLQ